MIRLHDPVTCRFAGQSVARNFGASCFTEAETLMPPFGRAYTVGMDMVARWESLNGYSLDPAGPQSWIRGSLVYEYLRHPPPA
jgi:hypothetical protein